MTGALTPEIDLDLETGVVSIVDMRIIDILILSDAHIDLAGRSASLGKMGLALRIGA